jgi:hypothetical protein
LTCGRVALKADVRRHTDRRRPRPSSRAIPSNLLTSPMIPSTGRVPQPRSRQSSLPSRRVLPHPDGCAGRLIKTAPTTDHRQHGRNLGTSRQRLDPQEPCARTTLRSAQRCQGRRASPKAAARRVTAQPVQRPSDGQSHANRHSRQEQAVASLFGRKQDQTSSKRRLKRIFADEHGMHVDGNPLYTAPTVPVTAMSPII